MITNIIPEATEPAVVRIAEIEITPSYDGK